jgi:hypothetical protein
VGPLRSRGWGSAPDAILSAPRFGTLIQVVWTGSADEDGFGYDPVTPQSEPVRGATRRVSGSIEWTRRTVTVSEEATPLQTVFPEFDELATFDAFGRGPASRRATLVEIDDDHGILFPPNSQVPSFDPNAVGEPAIALRVPGETLSAGMFVMWALLGDADLGGLQATDGNFSRIWKQRLRDELRRDTAGLVQRLRAAGIELQHLASRARRWWRPPSTVIHAPQQRRHFEALITVLGIDHDSPPAAHTHRRPWWQYAWNEIAHSRGEAIQTGMQEHEIIYEELFAFLGTLQSDLISRAASATTFQIEIPEGRSLRGTVRFYAVRSIEEGFCVPDHALRTICDLDSVEQWRG